MMLAFYPAESVSKCTFDAGVTPTALSIHVPCAPLMLMLLAARVLGTSVMCHDSHTGTATFHYYVDEAGSILTRTSRSHSFHSANFVA
jgi:hypothetical protein